jgi:putative heme degradation protein
MDARVKPRRTIRQARSQNPALRERELAAHLGVSEAELVAAHCSDGVLRIEHARETANRRRLVPLHSDYDSLDVSG